MCCIVSLHNPKLAVKFSKNIIALKNGKVILNNTNGITKKDINKIYN